MAAAPHSAEHDSRRRFLRALPGECHCRDIYRFADSTPQTSDWIATGRYVAAHSDLHSPGNLCGVNVGREGARGTLQFAAISKRSHSSRSSRSELRPAEEGIAVPIRRVRKPIRWRYGHVILPGRINLLNASDTKVQLTLTVP